MERVETLVQKLQEQLKQNVPMAKLLLTVKMLEHELLHLQQEDTAAGTAITISMPVNAQAPSVAEPVKEEAVQEAPPAEEEKVYQVLQVDESEVEAELEEIRRNAAVIQQISGHSKPQLLFEVNDEEDIPTLPKQQAPPVMKEVNDLAAAITSSVNDILKNNASEVGSGLADVPVKDLKKAIGINDRFLYVNELFRGDEAMYERSIKTINSFSIYAEAEYWIRRELKTKLGWTDTPTVKQFDQLVRRRFS